MNARHAMRLLVLILMAGPAAHADAPAARLETRLERPAKIWIGQRLHLDITLYTRGTFTGVPHFALPDESGMLILADDTHPLLGSSTLEGTGYLTKQYTITLLPLRAGDLTVPAFEVSFDYRDANQTTKSITLPTTAQRFRVLPVPGTDPALPLITTSHLEWKDDWKPTPGKARVGDAVTRVVSLTAEGLPGMVLPPLQIAHSDGVAAYPDPPRVETRTARGDFTGQREERHTYIFERPGRQTLTTRPVQWWDPANETLHAVVLDPVTYTVVPNLRLQSATGSANRSRLVAVLVGVAGMLFLTVAARRFRRRQRTPHDGARERRKTERYLYRLIVQATTDNDPTATLHNLQDWVDALYPDDSIPSLEEFARLTGDREFHTQIVSLQRHLFDRQDGRWSGQALYHALRQVRRKHLRTGYRNRFGQSVALPPLNPQGAVVRSRPII